MKLKEGFVLRDVCGHAVVVGEGHVDFGKLITLNETAAWLWSEAEDMGDFTVDALAARLCGRYDVTADVAKADVTKVIDGWKQCGMIE